MKNLLIPFFLCTPITLLLGMEPQKKIIPSTSLTSSAPTPKKQKFSQETRRHSAPRAIRLMGSSFHSAPNSPKKNKNQDNFFTEMVPSEENINTTDEKKDTYLIWTTRNNNPTSIKNILMFNNIDVNHKNKWGNTAMHYAAMLKYTEIITLLLYDPRTDTSLRNNENLYPRDCFIPETNNAEDEQIRISLFTRAMLNIIVNEEAFNLLVTGPINKESKNKTIDSIIKRLIQDYEHQDSYQPLPTEHQIPDYATKKFIKKMINAKINAKIEHA